MSAHTPGPWRPGRPDTLSTTEVTGKFVYAGRKGAKAQYVAIAVWGDVVPEQVLANADLIAAAPDLLALAHQYASECGECAGTRVCPDDSPCTECAAIWAVIDRAEGRS